MSSLLTRVTASSHRAAPFQAPIIPSSFSIFFPQHLSFSKNIFLVLYTAQPTSGLGSKPIHVLRPHRIDLGTPPKRDSPFLFDAAECSALFGTPVWHNKANPPNIPFSPSVHSGSLAVTLLVIKCRIRNSRKYLTPFGAPRAALVTHVRLLLYHSSTTRKYCTVLYQQGPRPPCPAIKTLGRTVLLQL